MHFFSLCNTENTACEYQNRDIVSAEARPPKEKKGKAKEEGKMRKTVEGKIRWSFLVRTRRRAHSNRNVVCFAVRSVILAVKKGGREKGQENGEQFRKKIYAKIRVFRCRLAYFGNIVLVVYWKMDYDYWYIVFNEGRYNACDSRNIKTPVMCVCTRTLESRWLHVFS